MTTKPIVVIGGGISGLSAAYYLKTFGQSVLKDKRIILVEASKRFGGWIRSLRHQDGVVYESGPRSFRVAGKPGLHALLLAESLGLSDEIIGVPKNSPAATKRCIYANNKLNLLPNKFFDVFKKIEPFSQRFYVYLGNEMRTPKLPLKEDDDISVYDFVEKRFGSEIAKYLADPFCRGITAGDAKQLSMKSMFPTFYEAERVHGSVMRGIFKPEKRDVDETRALLKSQLVMKALKNRWSIWTFRLGTESLTDSLLTHLSQSEKINIYNDSKVEKITFNDDGSANVTIATPDDTVNVDASHVFSAIPANSLSKCIHGDGFEKLRSNLEAIGSVHTVVVNLEYNGRDRLKDAGFGFLTPSSEELPVLGIVYDSAAFPQLDGENDVTRVTVMMGGAQFNQLFGSVDNVKEDDCLWTAVESVKKTLGINDNPARFHVSVNKNCIPQYTVGHSKRLAEIDAELIEKKLNLKLIGASYRGLSVNECIMNTKQTVSQFLAQQENIEL